MITTEPLIGSPWNLMLGNFITFFSCGYHWSKMTNAVHKNPRSFLPVSPTHVAINPRKEYKFNLYGKWTEKAFDLLFSLVLH